MAACAQKDKCVQNYILMSFNTFIVVGGIIGNMFIVILIGQKKKLQNITNLFVFNLSLANLAISAIVIPFTIIMELKYWVPNALECSIIMPVMEHFAAVCVLTHTAIGIARHMIVSQSKIVHEIKNRHVTFIIVLIWLIAFVILSVPLMGVLGRFVIIEVSNNSTKITQNQKNNSKSIKCELDFYSDQNRKSIYAVMIFSLTYVIPMVCTGFSYYRIHRIITVNAKNLKGYMPEDLLVSRKRRSRRLNRILLTMYIFFGSTTLPIQALYFLTGIMNNNIDKHPMFEIIWPITFTLFYLQVVTNPLVLLYMGAEYRRELYKLSVCFCLPPHFREASKKFRASLRISGRKYYRKTSLDEAKNLLKNNHSIKRNEYQFLDSRSTNGNVPPKSNKLNLDAKEIIKTPPSPKISEQQRQSEELIANIAIHPCVNFKANCLQMSEVEYFPLPYPQGDVFISNNSFSSEIKKTNTERIEEQIASNMHLFIESLNSGLRNSYNNLSKCNNDSCKFDTDSSRETIL